MTQEFDYQLCPSCKGEFTLAVTRCTECDVDLVAPDVAVDDPDALPPKEELVCIRVASVAWIEALSGGLEQREILHRVEPASAEDAPEGQSVEAFGKETLAGLYVLERDAEVAAELDHIIAAQALPHEYADELSEGEVEACPACGEELAEDATSCAECGLEFGV